MTTQFDETLLQDLDSFIKYYEFIDAEKVYTNGSELIQVSRIKQWFTYNKEKQKQLEEENKRLNNIIKPKEINYNYLKLLFEKKDKEEVIKSFVYKCEQLEKMYKSYEEKEIEVMKKDNIIDKAIEYINNYMPNYDFDHYNLEKLLKILKGEE